MTIINRFVDDYFFLDNFYPHEFELDGIKWKTVEHYFQANKCNPFNIIDFRTIADSETPNKAKALGRSVFLRPDWEDIKYDVMKAGVSKKFEDKELRQKLLDTEDAILIEGNYHHDNIWGNCLCWKCKEKNGSNWLGQILMEVREEIQNET